MKEIDWRRIWDSWGWTIPAIIIVLVVARLALGRGAFCAVENEHCLREWISATSGWAGFAAAMIGIYFVMRQLSEQVKQTSFQLGDAPPTLEILKIFAQEGAAQFRMVNWNRRLFGIRSVVVIVAGKAYFPEKIAKIRRLEDKIAELEYKNEDVRELKELLTIRPKPNWHDWYYCADEGRLHGLPVLRGWLDRQGPPVVYDFSILMPQNAFSYDREADATVILEVVHPGANLAPLKLQVRLKAMHLFSKLQIEGAVGELH